MSAAHKEKSSTTTNPMLPKISQLHFQLKLNKENNEIKTQLLSLIKEYKMAPFYQHICDEFKFKVDENFLTELKQENEAKLRDLNQKLQDKEKNFGATEVADCLVEIADYLTAIGEKEEAITAYTKAIEKVAGSGEKLDLCFSQFRIGLFFMDFDLIDRFCLKAKEMAEIGSGADWDRRNRLKVYEGMILCLKRKFNLASSLLIDGLATFNCNELMEYVEFVKYVVLVSVLVLGRVDLKEKIIDCPEVLEVIGDLPQLQEFVRSLYECRYGDFFKALAFVEEKYLKNDKYLHAHYHWYVKEMRLLAYTQLLESYKSVNLQSMASAFGVTVDWLDKDLVRFLVSGRLSCVIDRVNGLVESRKNDLKSEKYQKCIKVGDLLLNRIQRLTKIINA